MKQRIQQFWSWFLENEKHFWNYNQENCDDYLSEILEHLDFASDSDEYGIALEFYKVSPEKKRLEISADGVQELFDIIIQIANLSPKLENWDFVAFRQPLPAPFCLEFQNMKFDTTKMRFHPYQDDLHELHIVVFGDNFEEYKENNEGQFFHYGLITIDNLIGEYNCVMKIKGYDFVDINQIGEHVVYPLNELPKYIEDYYKENLEN